MDISSLIGGAGGGGGRNESAVGGAGQVGGAGRGASGAQSGTGDSGGSKWLPVVALLGFGMLLLAVVSILFKTSK